MVEFIRVADWEEEGYESAVSLERSSSDWFNREVWMERLGRLGWWGLRCVGGRWELNGVCVRRY